MWNVMENTHQSGCLQPIVSELYSIQDEWKEVAEQLLHDIDAARVRKDRQLEFYTRMLFWAVTGCDMPPPEFYCPISLEIMEDPVVLIETAVTYDKKSLDTWLHVYGSSRCPVSGQKLERLEYVENKALRCLIDDWKRHHMSQVSFRIIFVCRMTSFHCWIDCCVDTWSFLSECAQSNCASCAAILSSLLLCYNFEYGID